MDVAMQDAALNLPSLLDAAGQGQDVVITRDGRPVARLVALSDAEQSQDEVVASLSPSARRIWQSRVKLVGMTVADLMEENRRDQR